MLMVIAIESFSYYLVGKLVLVVWNCYMQVLDQGNL